MNSNMLKYFVKSFFKILGVVVVISIPLIAGFELLHQIAKRNAFAGLLFMIFVILVVVAYVDAAVWLQSKKNKKGGE